MTQRTHIFWLILLLLFVIGCQQVENTPAASSIITSTSRPTITATIRPFSTPSPSPTNTPTPTQTPSPTPTPTVTAVSIEIANTGQETVVQAPIAQGGAPCGLIDTLDFPIEPPDAETVSRGGGDFGRFRSRYDKYHAGEDWGAPAGRRNFGEPVYAIGHGRIMYAHPNGWGRDKGVVIVEHVLPNKRIIYSFYGHLDPPSVILNSGECVRRGDQIGNIGDPRTPPHLHFEIRTHMPYQPGPGYWPEDPTTAGWLPPSQTVWNQRMAAQNPAWIRPFTPPLQPTGNLNDTTFTFITDGQLITQNLDDSSTRDIPLAQEEDERIATALSLPEETAIYTANHLGHLIKYAADSTNSAETAVAYEKQWELDLESRGTPTLHPHPNGGVIVVMRDTLWAISPTGYLLWMADVQERPYAWASSADQLIFTTSGQNGATWQISAETPPQKIADFGGIPALSDNSIWVYAQNDVYQIDLDNAQNTAVSVYSLPTGFLPRGDLLTLPDDSILIAHTDIFDQRLISLNADGSLRWQRSYADLDAGNARLLLLNNQPHLITWQVNGSTTLVNVYSLDMETAVLTKIFTGGTRSSQYSNTWAIAPNPDQLLLSINDSIIAITAK